MKKIRQKKIIEIIEKYEVETQEQLREYLEKEGILVTQATLSRDIRELKLSKMSLDEGVGGKQRYVAFQRDQGDQGTEKYVRVLRDGFVSMDMAQNILVIKTVSGMAMAVAMAVDALQFPEVVGCIAGDDTIMVAIRTVDETRSLMGKISDIMG
ncbi:MAG: arginine repressor [Lachnospiraceae bacterium]|jgi:transcriptional regulator of arginine metabolism|nr:arginine repressor [Lachnospiraceae bacterium]MBP5264109.1 arginine repressor [Lachnospiraceae bacterium]